MVKETGRDYAEILQNACCKDHEKAHTLKKEEILNY